MWSASRLGGDHRRAPAVSGDARRLLCDAQIIPAVLSGRSEVLDVGRSSRTSRPRSGGHHPSRPRMCVARAATGRRPGATGTTWKWWQRDLGDTSYDNWRAALRLSPHRNSSGQMENPIRSRRNTRTRATTMARLETITAPQHHAPHQSDQADVRCATKVRLRRQPPSAKVWATDFSADSHTRCHWCSATTSATRRRCGKACRLLSTATGASSPPTGTVRSKRHRTK